MGKQDNCLIRPLTADDLAPVIEIDRQFTGRVRRGFFEKRLAAGLAEPQAFIYIGCQCAGALRGFVLARILEGEFGGNAPVAAMDGLAVDPDYMGKGLGRDLMLGLEGRLRHRGIGEIRTQADWTNFSLLRFLSYWGFGLSPRVVLERSCGNPSGRDEGRVNAGEDFETLPRDRNNIRSLDGRDLDALIRIAHRISNRDQTAYLKRKLGDALNESGVRVSLVAELDGHVAGFIMARVDFGDFGKSEPAAVIDTIGVDPDYAQRQVGSGLLSQLLINLGALRIERIRTEIDWHQFDLLAFLNRNDFRPSQRLALSRRLS